MSHDVGWFSAAVVGAFQSSVVVFLDRGIHFSGISIPLSQLTALTATLYCTIPENGCL